MRKLIPLLLILFSLPFFLQAQNYSEEDLYSMDLKELLNIRIKQTALLDVPHTHAKGEWMFSYHFMHMNMFNHLDGSNTLSNTQVLEKYMVAPTKMEMQMHMFHLMYAPSHRLTLMGMFNYTSNSMEQMPKMGDAFSVKTQGFDDINLSALYTIVEHEKSRLVGSLGLSIPVGSIEEKGLTPMSGGMEMKLPYPMQIGSGTWDPTVAATYFVVTSKHGWGADVRNTFRLHNNSNGYNWGNLFKVTGWYSRTWSQAFSTIFRLEMEKRENIQGADEDLNPMMAYTADPTRRGGSVLQAGLGFSFRPKGALRGSRISVEGKLPVYQHLNGPQLATQNAFKIALTHVLTTN